MKLIGSLTSPYVRKVRVVLAEKKLDYNFVLEDVWGSDAILASNPLGKVPCLVMEGGEAVFDSRVIVEYVDTLSPVGRLIPPSGRERVEVDATEDRRQSDDHDRAVERSDELGGRGVDESEVAVGDHDCRTARGDVRSRPFSGRSPP